MKWGYKLRTLMEITVPTIEQCGYYFKNNQANKQTKT